MAAGEPGILVDDAAERVLELVVGALPQRAEGAARGDDRIVVDAVPGADLGQPVGHAGAAGDAVDQPLGALEDACRTRGVAAISHSTFMWMRPWPPAISWAIRAWLMPPRIA